MFYLRTCPKCNSNVPPESSFCQKCGAKLAKANPKGRSPLLIAVIVMILISLTIVGSAYYIVNPKRINYSSIIPNIDVKEVTEFNFKNSYIRDIIAIGTAKDNVPAKEKNYVGIISFNLKKMAWEVVYEERLSSEASLKVTIARLLPDNVDQAIISTRVGSGAFLTYTLIGWVDNQVKLLLKRSSILQGSFVIEGNQLIEKSGHQGISYQWSGQSFVSTPMASENQAPLSVGDVQIEFSIDANENVRVSNMDVILKKGQKLFLRRTNTGKSERILVNGGPEAVLKSSPDRSFVGIRSGTTEIKIIPGGYEWSKVSIIKVTVTE